MLSFGAGQDSTAILYKLIKNNDFRKKYAPEDLIVVFADTNNEHPETYQHLRYIISLCERHNIDFFRLDSKEWASGDWKTGLVGFYKSGDRIGSKAFPKTCTDNLKIQPIYKFLERYIYNTYFTEHHGRKRSIKEFTKFNTLNVLIGISAGEESRVAKADKLDMPVWMRSINRIYPLIDIGYNRADCQQYLRDINAPIPIPSNCMLCPFISKQELLLLLLTHPEEVDRWIFLESNKIKKWSHLENNLGVWGKKLLPEILEEAKKQYGHMTLADLKRYRFSHGHCVQSKY